uniref:Disease resistance protein RGA2 n=1 Tax=Rhizophora mucronata TaxID=61149 RepID=A0A2P2NDI8_RHIMU
MLLLLIADPPLTTQLSMSMYTRSVNPPRNSSFSKGN